MKQNILHIQGICFDIFLGCLDFERKAPQSVEIDVKIKYGLAPKGCETDNLEDTLCYGLLAERIKKCCEKKHYNLIEHLAFELYQDIKQILRKEDRFFVAVKKVKIPIPEITQGGTYIYGDEI